MDKYELGSLKSSEALIKDLYIDLRTRVNSWADITKQTPQARMGYIGQHLVSVVSGYPGGKSGARGRDLVIDENTYGEIKTCYKVDQLGSCRQCGEPVSSLEDECSNCGSTDIERKDDSKWLIGIRNEDEFLNILGPEEYYFVLFEFEDYENPKHSTIDAEIWTVKSNNIGFIYCMLDYYLNIRANSKSKAPFNMWPHSLKFLITKPHLIYHSKIKPNNEIETLVFPTLKNTSDYEIPDIQLYYRATTLDEEIVSNVIRHYEPNYDTENKSKRQLLGKLEDLRFDLNITNSDLCDELARAIYLPLLRSVKDKIPKIYKDKYPELKF